MLERIVSLKIEETNAAVKTAMVEKGCRVLCEESPAQIFFKQGSVWGISPETAKKIIKVNLETVDSRTRVTCSSRLASDWKNITLIGCVLAIVLVGICVWMTTDLTTFMATREPSFWSWLLMVRGNVDLVAAQFFINLTWCLAVLLSVIILLEAIIVVYAGSKIDLFAKDALSQLN